MKQNKRFFVKFLVFLILVIGINTVLNAVYDQWMYYNRLNRNQDQQFLSFSDTLKYLMMGNSHNIVNPALLKNSYSYVTPRELYTHTYYKLKYILENTDKKPDYLLLSIDPLNFSPKAETDLTFDGYWRKYLDYCELISVSHDLSYLLNWASGHYFSYVGNFKFIYNSIPYLSLDFSKIKNGYFPRRNYRNFALEPKRDALGLERATAYLSSYNHQSVLGSVRYYTRILDLCSQYHIRPVLLRMPLSDEYLKHARQMVDMEKLDLDILGITSQHADDYILLDYRHTFSGQPEYFFNADHVNPIGANIISNKIREKLVNHRNPNHTPSIQQ